MSSKTIFRLGSVSIVLMAAMLLSGCQNDSVVLGTTATPGLLKIQATTDSLGAAARVVPSGQQAPDDVDVNLTPTAFTVAFKRIVIRQIDESTGQTLAEIELFSADSVDQALVVDLVNSQASDLLDAQDLPAGTYDKLDIEVFYMDMTVATIFPGDESHDIEYRMVYETMGLLEPRDFLLYLEPSWMTGYEQLSSEVTQAGFYWMNREDADVVLAVDGATEHPNFNVLDLFADDDFWNSEHKVLEGGMINPPLVYDPDEGGILSVDFDLEGKFNFKDYHDDSKAADGLWEIRYDSGIHPFPPDFECRPNPDNPVVEMGPDGP
jgi:hypothetical protein